MRKLLIALAAVAAAAIAVTVAVGSSHREAPGTMLDPSADDTDLYAFTAKDAPGALTVVGNWIPGQNPANGPNFFRFDDRARYYVNIDNTGDGRRTSPTGSSSRRRCATRTRSCTRCRARAATTTRSSTSLQRYSITRDDLPLPRQRVRVREHVIARDLPVAPPNIGPKTFPNYQAFVDGAIRTLTTARRCSSASATIRSSSTSARRSTRSTCASSPATRARARTTSPG